MSNIIERSLGERLLDLSSQEQNGIRSYYQDVEKVTDLVAQNTLILVNVGQNKLTYIGKDQVLNFKVSTARNGAGQEEGSFKTPLGVHKVCQKIGEGADPLAIFKSREDTGEKATIDEEPVSIVGRILRLEGLQPGLNKGVNGEGKLVDTFDRYVYIHGVNNLKELGSPASQGCINLSPPDVISLFDTVPEGTHVYVYPA